MVPCSVLLGTMNMYLVACGTFPQTLILANKTTATALSRPTIERNNFLATDHPIPTAQLCDHNNQSPKYTGTNIGINHGRFKYKCAHNIDPTPNIYNDSLSKSKRFVNNSKCEKYRNEQ